MNLVNTMLDERRRAESWKTRCLDAERQRDQAEAEIAKAADALRMVSHIVIDELARLDDFMFSVAKTAQRKE